MSAYLHVEHSDANLTLAEQTCTTLIEDDVWFPYCYEGFIVSSLFFYGNLTRAFSACNLNNKYKQFCYEKLQLLYNTSLWYDTNVSLCEFVDHTLRSDCYSEMKLHGIS